MNNTIGQVVSVFQATKEFSAINEKMHPVFLNWLKQAGNATKETFANISESVDGIKSERYKEFEHKHQLIVESFHKDKTITKESRESILKGLESEYAGAIKEFEQELITFQREVMPEDSGVSIPMVGIAFVPVWASMELIGKIYPAIKIDKKKFKKVSFHYAQAFTYMKVDLPEHASVNLKVAVVSVVEGFADTLQEFEDMRREFLTHEQFGDFTTERTAIKANKELSEEEAEALISGLSEKFPEVCEIEKKIAEIYNTPIEIDVPLAEIADLPEDGMTPSDFNLLMPLLRA